MTNEHHAVAEATLVEKLKGMTNLLGKHTLPSADQDRRDEARTSSIKLIRHAVDAKSAPETARS